MHNRNDPIIAISTAPGKGAVGIIRISGQNLNPFIGVLTQKTIEDRVATFLKLKDDNNQLIDEVVVIFFKAPNSYTGEDVLEIQGHGGPIVLQRIIKHCLTSSRKASSLNNNDHPVLPHLRIANPGEYSERAFLNNKIDLLQAEAISDLIDASTELASLGASRSLSGIFSKNIKNLLEDIKQTRVFIEAHIDFPEEEIGELELIKIKEKLLLEIEISKKLLAKTKNGLLLKEGVNTVITGQPNAGKSSIMNELCQQDVSIVTDIAGTTRDVVKQQMQIEGIPINLIDTAGINTNQTEQIDLVERIGIEKAWKEVASAELIIFVHDISKIVDKKYLKLDLEILEKINLNVSKNSKIIHILNKSDLIVEDKTLQQIKSSFEQEIKNESIVMSIKDKSNLIELNRKILEVIGWSSDNSENVSIARTRHLSSILKVKEHLEMALGFMSGKVLSLELIAEEMRLVQNALSEITGEFSSEDLLGEIFSKFCIGK